MPRRSETRALWAGLGEARLGRQGEILPGGRGSKDRGRGQPSERPALWLVPHAATIGHARSPGRCWPGGWRNERPKARSRRKQGKGPRGAAVHPWNLQNLWRSGPLWEPPLAKKGPRTWAGTLGYRVPPPTPDASRAPSQRGRPQNLWPGRRQPQIGPAAVRASGRWHSQPTLAPMPRRSTSGEGVAGHGLPPAEGRGPMPALQQGPESPRVAAPPLGAWPDRLSPNARCGLGLAHSCPCPAKPCSIGSPSKHRGLYFSSLPGSQSPWESGA